MRTAIMIFSCVMALACLVMEFDRKRLLLFVAFITFLATFSLAAGGVIG